MHCWLVVSNAGFACGYGGNKKVRVSARLRRKESENEKRSIYFERRFFIEHFLSTMFFKIIIKKSQLFTKISPYFKLGFLKIIRIVEIHFYSGANLI